MLYLLIWREVDTARPTDNAFSTPPNPPSGPMTRSRAKDLHDKVNSFLYMCDLDPTEDGMLPHTNALCILRYEPLHGSPDDGCEDGQEDNQDDGGEAALTRPVLPLPDHRYYRSPPVLPLPAGPALPPTTEGTEEGPKPDRHYRFDHRHRYCSNR